MGGTEMGKQQAEQIARAYMRMYGESFQRVGRRKVGVPVNKLVEALRRIGMHIFSSSTPFGRSAGRFRRPKE